jgi:hypothetical protein
MREMNEKIRSGMSFEPHWHLRPGVFDNRQQS